MVILTLVTFKINLASALLRMLINEKMEDRWLIEKSRENIVFVFWVVTVEKGFARKGKYVVGK